MGQNAGVVRAGLVFSLLFILFYFLFLFLGVFVCVCVCARDNPESKGMFCLKRFDSHVQSWKH